MGQPYGRINKRRSGAAWQWLVIGFFPGLLCGGLIIFVLLLNGIFKGITEPETVEVTREVQVVQVITTTPDLNASPIVQVITTTPEPTIEASLILPTATPVAVIQDAATAVVEATTELQATGVTDTGVSAQTVSTGASTSNVPEELQKVATGLVNVPGGTFQMGTDAVEIAQAAQICVTQDGGNCQASDGEDSTPRVAVQLSDFQIEQMEVSFSQYKDFLNWQNSQGLSHKTGCAGFLCIQTQNERTDAAVIAFDGANYFIPTRLQNLENHPVYGVTWYGANAYCQALGRRLPTEAEWEYAARGGGQNISYPWGNNFSLDYANVRVPAVQAEGQTTAPVDSYVLGRNSLGLLNMAGNVAEWTNDWYDPNYYQTLSQQQQATGQAILNPRGPAGGTTRVLRGGSFNALPFFARTYHRQDYYPATERDNDSYPLWIGFRCAADGNSSLAVQNTVPSSGTVDPASLGVTVPSTGSTDTNAQPTIAVPPEAQSTESTDRG